MPLSPGRHRGEKSAVTGESGLLLPTPAGWLHASGHCPHCGGEETVSRPGRGEAVLFCVCAAPGEAWMLQEGQGLQGVGCLPSCHPTLGLPCWAGLQLGVFSPFKAGPWASWESRESGVSLFPRSLGCLSCWCPGPGVPRTLDCSLWPSQPATGISSFLGGSNLVRSRAAGGV